MRVRVGRTAHSSTTDVRRIRNDRKIVTVCTIVFHTRIRMPINNSDARYRNVSDVPDFFLLTRASARCVMDVDGRTDGRFAPTATLRRTE